MIPTDLQRAFVAELDALFGDYLITDRKKVNIFFQWLPIDTGEDEGVADIFPYVLVIMNAGEIKGRDNTGFLSENLINVSFIVGVKDDNPNRQGYQDAVNMINAIYLHFMKNQFKPLAKLFSIQQNVKWELPDQSTDSHPFYMAALYTTWNAPRIAAFEHDDLT